MTDSVDPDGFEFPGRARALLDAVVAIGLDLDMHSVLERIVQSACELTGARYGALGVLGSGRFLVDFITHGVDDDQRKAIGELPRGHGILGLLIDEPRPLRLHHIQEDPHSFGFPPNHPPMERFLGVPVRIRGTVFGNLYLTEKSGGGDFTDEDEKLVEALATAAGFVIDNARAYSQSERRRQWLEASAQISEALQGAERLHDALLQIVSSTRRVSAASTVGLLMAAPDGGHAVAAVDGTRLADLPSLVEALDAALTRAAADGQLAVTHVEGRRVLLLPMRTQLADGGVLLVAYDEANREYDGEEAELLASLADQAALALDRAAALTDRQELMLVTDRDRIARDLHDLVIQRLFATGLQLQGARRMATSKDVQDRIDSAVRDLDVTISDIRSTIFELQHGSDVSVRADLQGVVREYVPVLGFTPAVRFHGPVDSAVPTPVAEQLLAVAREALSNVARHSGATASVVEVDVSAAAVTLRITDNGKGLPEDRHESGLRNVRRRASEHGGAVRFLAEEPHGTCIEWTVPLR